MAGASPRHRLSDTTGSAVQNDTMEDVNGFPVLASSPKRNVGVSRFYSQFKLGLSIAGVASCLLVTTFGLFHVDVFLRVYKLPLETYSRGNVAFAVVNTMNDFLGAWLLDSLASTSINRSELIGISGCIYAISFMTPFVRWKNPSKWDGLHFVASTSFYDTMYSFTANLQGSLVTDNHHMNDRERVWFMASGKIANLVASFVVARISLALFNENNMHRFRTFLLVLAIFTAALFLVSQLLTRYIVDWPTLQIRSANRPIPFVKRTSIQRLKFRQVIKDFWRHDNFWAWIGMELFLESQLSFINAFLKTFVDRLVYDSGRVTRENCDLLLSFIQPLGLITEIFCYLLIQRHGYQRLYPVMFGMNAMLCLHMLLFTTHRSTYQIILFLIVYPTVTVAVSSSGFHLAMSDMVLERKKMQVKEGRLDEPSLAAMYIGMNALFCKPAQSFLPIVAANMLGKLNLRYEGNHQVQSALFKVLVIPPLIFSIAEWMSWRRYTLTPQKTNQMREDLKGLPTTGQHSVMVYDEWSMDS